MFQCYQYFTWQCVWIYIFKSTCNRIPDDDNKYFKRGYINAYIFFEVVQKGGSLKY